MSKKGTLPQIPSSPVNNRPGSSTTEGRSVASSRPSSTKRKGAPNGRGRTYGDSPDPSRPSTAEFSVASGGTGQGKGRPGSGGKAPHNRKPEPIDEAAKALLQRREAVRIRLREDHQKSAIQSAEKQWHQEATQLLERIRDRDSTISEQEERILQLEAQAADKTREMQLLMDQKALMTSQLTTAEGDIERQKQEIARMLSSKGEELHIIARLEATIRGKEEELEDLKQSYRSAIHKSVHTEPPPSHLPPDELVEHRNIVKGLLQEWSERLEEKYNGMTELRDNHQENGTSWTLGMVERLESGLQMLRDVRGMSQYLHTMETSKSSDMLMAYTDMMEAGYSMHTNIPPPLKEKLYSMSKEQLVVLLDSMSFMKESLEFMKADLDPQYRIRPRLDFNEGEVVEVEEEEYLIMERPPDQPSKAFVVTAVNDLSAEEVEDLLSRSSPQQAPQRKTPTPPPPDRQTECSGASEGAQRGANPSDPGADPTELKVGARVAGEVNGDEGGVGGEGGEPVGEGGGGEGGEEGKAEREAMEERLEARPPPLLIRKVKGKEEVLRQELKETLNSFIEATAYDEQLSRAGVYEAESAKWGEVLARKEALLFRGPPPLSTEIHQVLMEANEKRVKGLLPEAGALLDSAMNRIRDARLHCERGVIYFQLPTKDLGSALQQFARAIELLPTHSKSWRERGRVHAEMQNYDQALSDFTRAIVLGSIEAETFSCRADVYLLSDRTQEAWEDILSGMDCDATHEGILAKYEKVRPILGQQQKEGATKALQKCKEVNPALEFAKNSPEVDASSPLLSAVAEVLQQFTAVRLKITVVTASKKLVKLCDERGQTVSRHLVNLGINPLRMTTNSVTGTDPKGTPCSFTIHNE